MRDVLVTLLFMYGMVWALRRPYVAALLWVWVGLMNPHRLGWGFAYDLPFGLISAAVLILSMAMHSREVSWPRGMAPIRLLVVLMLWMGVTSVTALHVDLSLLKYVDVLKVLGVTLLVASVVIDRRQIIGLIWMATLSIAFFGIKGGIFTISTGGAFRVWGPPSSLVNGNNELALALVITIPLLYFLARNLHLSADLPFIGKISPGWLKRGLYLSMVLCAIAAVGSQSRGAFLAIGAMSVFLWWRSRSKLSLGFMLLMLVPAVLMFMPEEWMERMHTIHNFEEDRSAMGRIHAWTMAVNIANDRFFGGGFATATKYVYALYAPPEAHDTLVAHSVYFQILGEHGYVGLMIYLWFWWATYRTANRLGRYAKATKELAWVGELGAMCKVSMIGFAVGGAFLSLAYWDMPFYLMVVLVATEHYVKAHLSAGATAAETAAARAAVAPERSTGPVGQPRAAG